jgi:hypothetical protein
VVPDRSLLEWQEAKGERQSARKSISKLYILEIIKIKREKEEEQSSVPYEHSTQEVAVTRDCDVIFFVLCTQRRSRPWTSIIRNLTAQATRSLRPLMPPPPRAVAVGVHLVDCVCCE